MRRHRSAFAGEIEDEIAGPRACEMAGCANPGRFRAPKRKAAVEPTRWLCLDHIREANSRWNYFEGMPDEDLAAYQRNDPTWHRPTWKIGSERRLGFDPGMDDPLGLLGGEIPVQQAEPRGKTVSSLVRRSLEALEMTPAASFQDIKTRYKELVKRYHPDLNGGDRSSEERLKQVIQAYNHLRASGYC